jgi:hypothetical protein
MGRSRGKLKRNKIGKKFVRDRVLRGKIVCNRSSGSIQYETMVREVCLELIVAMLP